MSNTKIDATKAYKHELYRMRNRCWERRPENVRKDVQEQYVETLQMIDGLFQALEDAADLGANVSVTVSLVQPHLPGLDENRLDKRTFSIPETDHDIPF